MVTRVPKEPACPFCGSTDNYGWSSSDMGPHYMHFVQCNACGAKGPRSNTPDSAKASWSKGLRRE